MLRKLLLAFTSLVLLASAWLAFRLPPMLAGANGYAAKWVCSNVFVGGRTLAEATADLPPNPLVSWLDIEEDHEGLITARLFGRFARSALYRESFGCTLLPPGTKREALSPVPALRSSVQTEEATFSAASIGFETLDLEAVQAAAARAFIEEVPEKPKNTRAVVVLWGGALVSEIYADGFDAATRFPGWSMTKSVLNALYGRAALMGHLDIADSPAIPAWQDERRAITYDQLLRMSSGLAFKENYADLASDAVRMLFVDADSGSFAADKELESPPDTSWYYSSGTSNVLSRQLRQILGDSEYLRFAHDELFAPLGMASALIEPDASGTFVASSFGWATARDWARFGQLYLQDGVHDGKRLLPEGWVDYTRRPTPKAPRGLYGAHFWLNADSPDGAEDRRWPELPNDLYLASGFEGQAVVIVPSRHAVIVRLGLSQAGSTWSLPTFVREVLDALPENPPPRPAAPETPSSSALPALGVESVP